MRFLEPETVISHFHLRKGDRVGDYGAGSGHFTLSLAKKVGAEGRVYAVEIQKELVERIAESVRNSRTSNVEVIWGDLEDTSGIRISDGTLDAAVLSNTLFQIEQKERALTEIARTLRKGGKFFLIEWADSFGGMGPHPDNIVSADEARTIAEAAGLSFDRTFPAGAHHYGLAFRR